MNPVLDVFLYENRWQLATEDALYSDGDHYRPLKLAFAHIGEDLQRLKTMLLLGTGLGSAVYILHRMGVHPETTLVELDETVLGLATALMPAKLTGRLHPVCANAADYIRSCDASFDLLVVDVFIGREVPLFVTSAAFLQQCYLRLNKDGYFVLNYMMEGQAELQRMQNLIREVFPRFEEKGFGVNRIFIARK